MGCHKNIAVTRFPKQGRWLGREVSVCFHYDTFTTLLGRIVRDDIEEPFETIFALNDGRFVRAAECQYTLLDSRYGGGLETDAPSDEAKAKGPA